MEEQEKGGGGGGGHTFLVLINPPAGMFKPRKVYEVHRVGIEVSAIEMRGQARSVVPPFPLAARHRRDVAAQVEFESKS